MPQPRPYLVTVKATTEAQFAVVADDEYAAGCKWPDGVKVTPEKRGRVYEIAEIDPSEYDRLFQEAIHRGDALPE
jgi:hypothetical protein